jgi:hypothetical protein
LRSSFSCSAFRSFVLPEPTQRIELYSKRLYHSEGRRV